MTLQHGDDVTTLTITDKTFDENASSDVYKAVQNLLPGGREDLVPVNSSRAGTLGGTYLDVLMFFCLNVCLKNVRSYYYFVCA